MNFQFYLEKLMASDNFKNFIDEHKDAVPVSGFFVIDLEGKDNKQHFDYFVPSINKMFSFQLENKCDLVPVELIGEKPEKIAMNYNFDFSDIKNLVQKEMTAKNITNKVQKLLFSLQHKDKKDYLVGTVFISNFGMLKVNIDITDMKIVDFEKKSFFDILRVTKKSKEEK